jgi:hypothetical protein
MSDRDQRIARSFRLLKKAHLLRWFASAFAATYRQYASLSLQQTALHLALFEQPGQEEGLFRILLTVGSGNRKEEDTRWILPPWPPKAAVAAR